MALYEQQHGNPREAIRLYRNSLVETDDPLERAKVFQNMSVAYRDIGDDAQAAECLRKMVKLRKR
jgi:tetratricopeptide (TPR) repeat protein